MEDEEHSGFGDGLSSRNGGEASRSLVCGSFDFQRDNRDLKMVVEEKCSECSELKVQYDLLMKEQLEVKRSLEDVKRENEVKSRECREAWGTLHELQMELMCKSMHVGSLAFAVEGRVKEKSRWFLSLEELSKKFEVWDATTGQRQYLFEGHDAPVYSICPYCKESIQFIFSTAIDGKIKAWLYDCLGSRVDYNAPGLWCTTMAYSADGTRFACNLLRQGMHQICLSAVSTCLTVEDSKELGTGLSIFMSKRKPSLVTSFAILSCGYVVSSYQEVRSVVLHTLNRARFTVAVESFLKTGYVPSLKEGNLKESIFNPPWSKQPIVLGSRFGDAFHEPSSFLAIEPLFEKERYIVTCNPSKGNIHALLKDQAKSDDVLKAAFHAHVLSQFIQSRNANFSSSLDMKYSSSNQVMPTNSDFLDFIEESCKIVTSSYGDFKLKAADQGWIMSESLLNPGLARICELKEL